MQWKFWQRWRKRNRKDERERDSSAFSVLLSHSSAQEILGLQRMVGNQAVLQILEPEKTDATVDAVKTQTRGLRRYVGL